jgi:protein involved in polysaccharide export with SLBB domain
MGFQLTVLRSAIAVVCCAILAGCTTQEITVREKNPQGFAPWTDQAFEHHLGSGDRVNVYFPLTPENNEEVLVAPDGYVALKITGRLKANGLSVSQLQDVIKDAAAKNLKTPMVVAALADSRSARIVIGGQVKNPGSYAVTARPTVMEIVMLAGGFLPEGRMNEVVVLRMKPDNTAMLRRIDLQRFISRGDMNENITLQPEDMIFVPRSRVAEVNWWIEEYINRNLPFGRQLSYTKTQAVGAASPFVTP